MGFNSSSKTNPFSLIQFIFLIMTFSESVCQFDKNGESGFVVKAGPGCVCGREVMVVFSNFDLKKYL